MSKPSEEFRFKSNVLGIAEDIKYNIELLHTKKVTSIEPTSIQMMIDLIKIINPKMVIDEFIVKSYQHWDKIKERDESFFLNHAGNIFPFLPQEKMAPFLQLFHTNDNAGKCVISDELKDTIWNNLHGMIKICIRYIHKHREQNEEFHEDVDLQANAQTWGLKL